MWCSDDKIEEELADAGNRLLHPPESPPELLGLLDKIEDNLRKVEQSPSESMQNALSPVLKALVSDKLLKHSDIDVRVAVASCLNEVTRITAPDAPYYDDIMKDIFRLIVSSFEHLDDRSSRSYAKRVTILETVSKVRSCVIMLDLECDQMIIEMFQHFIKAIRDFHPEYVLSSMKTIMTLVLEESEEISPELLSVLLASVKRNSEEIRPAGMKLGERVFEKCAVKLKPYLTHAVKTLGLSLDDYSEVVASICKETFGNQLVTEMKSATNSPDQALATQVGKDIKEEKSSEELNPDVRGSPKAIESKGVDETVNGGILSNADIKKEEVLDHNLTSKADSDDLAPQIPISSEPKPVLASNGSRTEPNSSNNPVEAADIVDGEKQIGQAPDHQESEVKDIHVSSSEEATDETTKSLDNVEETGIHLSTSNASAREALIVASPPPTRSPLDESCPKKASQEKMKENLKEKRVSDDDASEKDASEKALDGASDSEARKRSNLGGEEPMEISNENQVLADEDAWKEESTFETEKSLNNIKETGIHLSPSNESEREPVTVASPSPTRSLLNESRLKKGGRKRKKGSSITEKNDSVDVPSAKVLDGESDSEVKKRRRLGGKEPAEISNGNQVLAEEDACEDGLVNHLEEKLQNEKDKPVDANDGKKDGSSSKKGGGIKRGRKKAAVEKDVLKSAAKDDARHTVSSPSSPKKSTKDEDSQEETPRVISNKKGTRSTDKASGAIEYAENLIGLKVKVWWPKDKAFYDGVVESFDSVKKKHKILYQDGDEEILNLRKETWEFVEDGSESDAEELVERASIDTPSEMNRKKSKTNPKASSNDGKTKAKTPSKSKPKNTAIKSGKSKQEAKADPMSDEDHSSSGDEESLKASGKSKGFEASSNDGKTRTSRRSKAKNTAIKPGKSKHDTKADPISDDDTSSSGDDESPKASGKSKGVEASSNDVKTKTSRKSKPKNPASKPGKSKQDAKVDLMSEDGTSSSGDDELPKASGKSKGVEASSNDVKTKTSRKSKPKNPASKPGKSKQDAKVDLMSEDGTSSSGDDELPKASGKSKGVDKAKTSGQSKQVMQKTTPKSKGKNSTGDANGNKGKGKAKLGPSKLMKETDHVKEKITDSGKKSENKKGKSQDTSTPRKSVTKTGKKRGRGTR